MGELEIYIGIIKFQSTVPTDSLYSILAILYKVFKTKSHHLYLLKNILYYCSTSCVFGINLNFNTYTTL